MRRSRNIGGCKDIKGVYVLRRGIFELSYGCTALAYRLHLSSFLRLLLFLVRPSSSTLLSTPRTLCKRVIVPSHTGPVRSFDVLRTGYIAQTS